MVDVADAGEITLHEVLPLLVLDHPLVPLHAAVRVGVVEIVDPVLGQFDLLDRVKIEPLLWHLEGDVRPEQADGKEERLVSGLVHLGDSPVHHHVVAGLLVGLLEWLGTEVLAASQRSPRREARLGIGNQLRSRPVR